MKRILPLLVCCAAGLQGARPEEALTAHLRDTALLHGAFTQTRRIAALSRPLVSTGEIVVDRERGVIWHIQKPLELTFVIGTGGIVEVDAAGRRKAQASKEAPMVAQMGRIVKSLLKGQWSAVEDYFTIRGEGSPARWEIILEPKSATAAYLKGVRVQGGAFLERIRVQEASGDTMELVFRNLRKDLPLSGAEAQLLSIK